MMDDTVATEGKEVAVEEKEAPKKIHDPVNLLLAFCPFRHYNEGEKMIHDRESVARKAKTISTAGCITNGESGFWDTLNLLTCF